MEESAARSPLSSTEAVSSSSLGLDLRSARELVDVFHQADIEACRSLEGAAVAIAALIDDVVASFERGGRLLYFGAGTSGRLGVLDASECPPTFGVDPGRVVACIAGGDRALREACEGAEDDRDDGQRSAREQGVSKDDVVCGIAASGRTPWVHGALDEARRVGARTALVTSNVHLAAQIDVGGLDHIILLDVGPEVLAGSTRLKCGTATKLALNRVTTGAMVRWGKVYDNLMVDVRATNEKLRHRALRLVVRIAAVDESTAGTCLERAGGEVKTAVLLARGLPDAAAAEELLARHRGFLRAALEEVERRP